MKIFMLIFKIILLIKYWLSYIIVGAHLVWLLTVYVISKIWDEKYKINLVKSIK